MIIGLIRCFGKMLKLKFKLIPVDKIPDRWIVKINRIRKARIYDELEIAYIKRIAGKDIRPSLRR